ncbi:hypothetical protein I4U23_004844 [Adineta vaga]|nr:hypothetical protein I4U23_004844 [Adineta vaga]
MNNFDGSSTVKVNSPKFANHVSSGQLSSNDSMNKARTSTTSKALEPNFKDIQIQKSASIINRSIEPRSISDEQIKRRRRRRSIPPSWLKLCCCSLASIILITLLLCGAIVAGFLTKLPKGRQTIALVYVTTTTSMTSSSLTTSFSTTSTTVSTSTSTPTTTSVTNSMVTTTTSAGTTTTPFNSTLNQNLLINGNGETGPCETGGSVTHPTGWNYNGTITQISYNNPTYGDLTHSDPGPSNRGNCYFYGQLSTVTSMWQTVNLTNTIDPLLIDTSAVKFNLSAWIGGWSYQNDNARVSKLGNTTTIGPVYAADRNSTSMLLFRQATGFVPVGTRSFTVLVTIMCTDPTSNDGDVDNIGIYFFQ